MAPSSFGLPPNYKETILEECYQVTRFCKNISWTEVWDMPIEYRRWLIKREGKQRKEEEEAVKKAQKSPKGG